MKKFCVLLLVSCIGISSFAKGIVANDVYTGSAVRISDKPFKELDWKEPAVIKGDYEYVFKKSGIKRRPVGSNEKFRTFFVGDAYQLFEGCQSSYDEYKKGRKMAGVSVACMWFVGFAPAIPFACVADNKCKYAISHFYEDCLTQKRLAPDAGVEVSQEEVALATEQSSQSVQPEAELVEVVEETNKAVEENVVAAEPVEVAPQATTETKPEPVAQVNNQKQSVAPVKVEKEKKVKEPKERGPKLNVRKKNGVGLWVDPLGFAFRGPRLGLDIRLNRNVPFVFVGCPQLGHSYMSDFDRTESEKSISCGVGYKHLVPASWGGFYIGVFGQYNRLSADINAVSKYKDQKIFESGIDAMANLGFRFQCKNNLFFNVGGYAGIANNTHEYRFTNVLSNSYSAKYIKGDTETKFKGAAEVSLGYEF